MRSTNITLQLGPTARLLLAVPAFFILFFGGANTIHTAIDNSDVQALLGGLLVWAAAIASLCAASL